MKLKFLPQEALKLIAGLTMLIDHIGATLYRSGKLRAIGRVAFPIYCFLMAEGLRHTRDKTKYLLRLGFGLILSELPFDLLFFGGFTWAHQSVMFTLGLGCLMGCIMDYLPHLLLKPLVAIPFYFAAEFLHTDYGGMGVLMVGLFLLSEELPMKRLIQTIGVAALCFFIPSTKVSLLGFRFPLQLFAVFAMVPICLYSGKKLTHSRALQWGFYLWYPVHLAVLYLICLLK